MDGSPRSTRSRRAALALLGAAAVLVAGCRLDVTAAVEVARDGSGTAAVELRLDPALLDELDALGVDPTAELAATAPVEGWAVERRGDEGGGLVVRLEHATDEPGGIGDAFRELVAGLAADDPALQVDLDVDVGADGAVGVAGTVGFRPPATAGTRLDGRPVGPDAAELARMTAQAVAPVLVVTLPGAIAEHDGDVLDGRTVRWEVPVGATRSVTAASAPPTLRDSPLFLPAVLAAAGVILLVAVGTAWARTRRGR